MPVGWNAKLSRGDAGADPATEMTEMTNVRDVKLPLSVGEADISTRANRFERVDAALFVASIDWDMLWDETDSDFTAIWTAYKTGAKIALMALGMASGSGILGDFVIAKCEAAQDLKGAQIANVSAKPTKGSLAPAFATYTEE